MRLIDADALKDKVADLYTEGEEATEGDKLINNVIDIIDAEEAIKSQRPQGEWIYNDYGDGCGNWHCSVCDHMPYYATKYMRFLNFCPNCGADLRGVDK